MLKPVEDGGIFLWDSDCLTMLEGAKGLAGDLQEKQLHMVGYLGELFLDLCICPSKNASQSPGFEAVCTTSKGAM